MKIITDDGRRVGEPAAEHQEAIPQWLAEDLSEITDWIANWTAGQEIVRCFVCDKELDIAEALGQHPDIVGQQLGMVLCSQCTGAHRIKPRGWAAAATLCTPGSSTHVRILGSAPGEQKSISCNGGKGSRKAAR